MGRANRFLIERRGAFDWQFCQRRKRFPAQPETALFHLGRHAEGREMWKRAAELGAEPVIAYRALGMAAKTLDNDLPSARDWLTKANHAECVAQDPSNVEWALFLRPAMSNSIYSDLTIAQAHGNGIEIGGGPFFLNRFSTYDLKNWVLGYQPANKSRLRKAAIWTCFSGSISDETGNLGFPQACGIRNTALQVSSFMRKNCGLFFGGKIDTAFWSGGQLVTTGRAAAFLDQTWICGKFQWPGACDPTYSFDFAIQATLQQYPELQPAELRRFGYPSMIYTSVYDDELLMLDTSHVKNN